MENELPSLPGVSGVVDNKQYYAKQAHGDNVLRQVQDRSTQLGVAAARTHPPPPPASYTSTSSPCTSHMTPSFRASPPAEPSLVRLRSHVPALPTVSWTRIETVWNNMCWKDTAYVRNPHYLTKTRDVEPEMRAILLDWMSEVAEVYKMQRETYYLSVDIFDRFMSQTPDIVPKHDLQLIGVSALFLAAKTEEIYPPKIDQFAYVTDQAFSENQIRKAELLICKTLKWALSPVTAVQWMGTYLQIAGNVITGGDNQQQQHMAHNSYKRRLFEDGTTRPSTVDNMSKRMYHTPTYINCCQLLDLCTLDLGWLSHSYGVLAASAMYCLAADPALALHVSGYSFAELQTCIQWMRPFAQVFRTIDEHTPTCIQGVSADSTHHIHTRHVNITHLKEVHAGQMQLENMLLRTGTTGCPFPTPPISDQQQYAHRARTQYSDSMDVISE
jgi:cyclin E